MMREDIFGMSYVEATRKLVESRDWPQDAYSALVNLAGIALEIDTNGVSASLANAYDNTLNRLLRRYPAEVAKPQSEFEKLMQGALGG